MVEPGEFIYRQGDPADGLYVLLPGEVAALPQFADVSWTNLKTGRILRLERVRAPALLGQAEIVQSGLLLRHQAGARRPGATRVFLTGARAATALKVMRISFQIFELLTPEEAVSLSAALGRNVADAFAGVLNVLDDALVDDGTYRLAAWLREETAISFTEGAGGTTGRTAPLSQEEIAKQIGLRRDTLNQKLSALRSAGVLSVLPGGEILIHDLERLDQLADLAVRLDFETFAIARDTIADALKAGNAYRARNLALDALGRFPNHPEIRHQAVLAMLRCGSFDEAGGLLKVFGWNGALSTILASIDEGYRSPGGGKGRDNADEGGTEDADEQERWESDRIRTSGRLRVDIPALSARMAKDIAFAASAMRNQRFKSMAVEAAGRYRAVSDRFQSDAYSAINAAAMAQVSGDGVGAKNYAQRALDKGAPQTRYWDHATAMESHLILGQREPALAAARAAASVGISQAGDVASTRLQLRRLAPFCGPLTNELRDLLRQKRVVYATGHLPPQPDPELARWRHAAAELEAAVDQIYAENEIGAVFCALAAGSDLLLAERALKAKVSVHVVLPVPTDEFLDRSVRVGDADANRYWRQCFDRVIGQARTVTILEEDKPVKVRLPFDEAVYVGNRHAVGLALIQADEWESEAVMVCIHDGSGPGSIAGTSRIRADWQAQGHRAISIAARWRDGRVAAPQEAVPNSFGAVLFVWLAVPGDYDRHRAKQASLVKEYTDRAASILELLATRQLRPEEQLKPRVLADKMVGFYVGLRDVARAQDLAAVLCQAIIPGLDGLRVVLDYGSVFTGTGLSEPRVAALQGARDNIELPLGTVVLTEAFAAAARLHIREPAPFAQIGLQTRKADGSRAPRAAMRYFRSMSAGMASDA
ncbi:hypothetical protein MSPGM_12060 [Methylorubrum sp. GM97]|nr:hypothetical protein MSPGM_12060 [Methylorubrum sp. GM97]